LLKDEGTGLPTPFTIGAHRAPGRDDEIASEIADRASRFETVRAGKRIFVEIVVFVLELSMLVARMRGFHVVLSLLRCLGDACNHLGDDPDLPPLFGSRIM
jgi:hypothetical protein